MRAACQRSAERARGMVGKNIRSMVDKIRRRASRVGASFLLRDQHRLFLRIQPDPDHPISWQL